MNLLDRDVIDSFRRFLRAAGLCLSCMDTGHFCCSTEFLKFLTTYKVLVDHGDLFLAAEGLI